MAWKQMMWKNLRNDAGRPNKDAGQLAHMANPNGESFLQKTEQIIAGAYNGQLNGMDQPANLGYGTDPRLCVNQPCAADLQPKVVLEEGRLVDYFDGSLECWIPAKITEIDGETGALKVNMNPDRLLNSVEQRQLLRPRTSPSQRQLENLQALLENGHIDEEAAWLFERFAVSGTCSGLVLYRSSLPDIGASVDAFLGICGSLRTLSAAIDRSDGGVLNSDHFAEVFWELVKRVRLEHGDAINHDPSKSGRTTRVQDAYKFERTLGEGSFGTVFFARCLQTGARRAIKKVHKGRNWGTMDQEMKILFSLDHPHIIKLYEKFDDWNSVYLVTDYCSGGDLEKTMKKRMSMMSDFPETYLSDVMNQILLAIAHVHARGILHLDLKPANIMLMPKQGTLPPSKNLAGVTLVGEMDLKPHVMVIDLGVADLFRPGNFSGNKPAGSPAYMAPEVWKGEFTPKADIFSLGVMLFQLLSWNLPLSGVPSKTANAIQYYDQQPQVQWDRMHTGRSDVAIGLCRYMLILDRHQRPSALKCLETRFIKEAGNILTVRPSLQFPEKYIRRLTLLPHRTVLHNSIALALARAWPSNQLPTIKRMFEALDVERNGRLDPIRLKDALKRLGLAAEQAQDVAYAMDLNRDGSVGWTEFVASCIDLGDLALEKDLKRIFHEADSNGDGKLSQSEFMKLFACDQLSEQTVKDIFVDLGNRSGNSEVIDWPTFRRYLGFDTDADPEPEIPEAQDDAHHARVLTPRVTPFANTDHGQCNALSFFTQAVGFIDRAREVLFPPDIDTVHLQANMILLKDMGMFNEEKNEAALRKYKNKITDKLLDELLSQ